MTPSSYVKIRKDALLPLAFLLWLKIQIHVWIIPYYFVMCVKYLIKMISDWFLPCDLFITAIVIEVAYILSEKLLHMLGDKGKALYLSSWPTRDKAQIRANSQHKISKAYLYVRLLHFIYAVILKSFLGPSSRLHFKQFKETGDHQSGYLGR